MERQVPSGYGGGLALGGAVCVGIQASIGYAFDMQKHCLLLLQRSNLS
jgi:hypothetical protein